MIALQSSLEIESTPNYDTILWVKTSLTDQTSLSNLGLYRTTNQIHQFTTVGKGMLITSMQNSL